jgi:hypothetical protein
MYTILRRGGREEKDVQKRKRQLLCITRTSGPALLALKADPEEVRTEKDRTRKPTRMFCNYKTS